MTELSNIAIGMAYVLCTFAYMVIFFATLRALCLAVGLCKPRRMDYRATKHARSRKDTFTALYGG